jgi:hypothetical protein
VSGTPIEPRPDWFRPLRGYGYRKVEVDGVIWQYRIYGHYIVAYKEGKGKRFRVKRQCSRALASASGVYTHEVVKWIRSELSHVPERINESSFKALIPFLRYRLHGCGSPFH